MKKAFDMFKKKIEKKEKKEKKEKQEKIVGTTTIITQLGCTPADTLSKYNLSTMRGLGENEDLLPSMKEQTQELQRKLRAEYVKQVMETYSEQKTNDENVTIRIKEAVGPSSAPGKGYVGLTLEKRNSNMPEGNVHVGPSSNTETFNETNDDGYVQTGPSVTP